MGAQERKISAWIVAVSKPKRLNDKKVKGKNGIRGRII